MDKYVVKKCLNGEGTFYYYKSGLLHREAGPAIIDHCDKHKFLNLGDEHLYKEEILQAAMPANFLTTMIKTKGSNLLSNLFLLNYYLNGEAYTKEEFEKAKIKLDLKKELDRELDTSQSNIRKTKI
jgi:hypothetical protein